MNISKDSWHYKLHKLFETQIYYRLNGASWNEKNIVTLCEYFWKTVYMVLVGMGCTIFLIHIGLWFLNGLLIFVLALFNVFPEFLLYDLAFGVWLGVLFIGMFITLGISLEMWAKGKMKFAPEYITKYFPKKTGDKVATSKPSLVAEYIKAKKSKWCPIVELDKE